MFKAKQPAGLVISILFMPNTPDNIYFQIAGFNFQLKFHKTDWKRLEEKFKSEVLNYLNEFLLTEKPKNLDYRIDVFQRLQPKILFAKKMGDNFIDFSTSVTNKSAITYYDISIHEFEIVVADAISGLLVKNGGFILHASSTKISSCAYIFLGKSGAGKSTIVSLLKNHYQALAGDIVFIKAENGYQLYQSPYFEKDFWIKKNTMAIPLRKIFVLKKSSFFKIEKIKHNEDLVEKMIGSVKLRKEYMNKNIKNILKFLSGFEEVYLLYFVKNENKLVKFISEKL